MVLDKNTYRSECGPNGLTSAEVDSRILRYGKNVLPARSHPGVLVIFLHQFKSRFIYVLLVAAIISFGLNQTIYAFFIFAVLLLNASIGTVQEYAAERAAAALKKMLPSQAVVIRDGAARVKSSLPAIRSRLEKSLLISVLKTISSHHSCNALNALPCASPTAS